MSQYNPYFDIRNYPGEKNLREETIPANPIFSCQPDEQCSYPPIEGLPFPTMLHNLDVGNITLLDKKIISLVAVYQFMTTVQISDFLTLLGVPFTSTRLKSSLDRLQKNQLLSVMRFENAVTKEVAGFKVFTLHKNGSELAKQMNVQHSYSPYSRGMLASDVKRILETNQVCSIFLKSSLKIDWFKRGEVISSKQCKDAVVRPSLAVCVDGEVLLFEVVRKGEFWKTNLENKLMRYMKLFENWAENAWGLQELPALVINGESQEHNAEIAEMAKELGMQLLFTEDLKLCGASFYQSLYEFAADGTPEYFRFEEPAETPITA